MNCSQWFLARLKVPGRRSSRESSFNLCWHLTPAIGVLAQAYNLIQHMFPFPYFLRPRLVVNEESKALSADGRARLKITMRTCTHDFWLLDATTSEVNSQGRIFIGNGPNAVSESTVSNTKLSVVLASLSSGERTQ